MRQRLMFLLVAVLGLVFVMSCEVPAVGLKPTDQGTNTPPEQPIDPQFDCTITGAGSLTQLRRSSILLSVPSSTTLGGSLDFFVQTNDPSLNIEEINTIYTFVRADGSSVTVTGTNSSGGQSFVFETLFADSHLGTYSVGERLSKLVVNGSDLFHIGTWNEFTKLRVLMGIGYFQKAPGVPGRQISKTMEFALVQDLPAIDGVSYLPFFDVVPFSETAPGTIDSQWTFSAEVTYPDGSVVSSPPSQVFDDEASFFLIGFRPANTTTPEHWEIKLDKHDGSPGIVWTIPDGFPLLGSSSANFFCELDDQGLPIVQ